LETNNGRFPFDTPLKLLWLVRKHEYANEKLMIRMRNCLDEYNSFILLIKDSLHTHLSKFADSGHFGTIYVEKK
jgi:hypothetical protein